MPMEVSNFDCPLKEISDFRSRGLRYICTSVSTKKDGSSVTKLIRTYQKELKKMRHPIRKYM